MFYITAAQPNPRGRDVIRPGFATNEKLNEEWVEFQATTPESLEGVSISHLKFRHPCIIGDAEQLTTFTGTLAQGQSIRLHTGQGQIYLDGSRYHMYLNRTWFVWNNDCGDRATISHAGRVLDSAGYRPRPPEEMLVRVPGTDRLESRR